MYDRFKLQLQCTYNVFEMCNNKNHQYLYNVFYNCFRLTGVYSIYIDSIGLILGTYLHFIDFIPSMSSCYTCKENSVDIEVNAIISPCCLNSHELL